MLLDLTLANLSSPMDTRNFVRATDDDVLSNLKKGRVNVMLFISVRFLSDSCYAVYRCKIAKISMSSSHFIN